MYITHVHFIKEKYYSLMAFIECLSMQRTTQTTSRLVKQYDTTSYMKSAFIIN